MKIFSKDQFKEMPWKNGGGTTTELLRIPGDSDHFTIRLSVATVSSEGPFSTFPEIDRTLLILKGNGVQLKLPDNEVTLTQESIPFAFAGETQINCSLINGEVKDFNVMLRRGFGKATAEKMMNPELKCEDKLLYVYNIDDEKLFELTKGERIKLKGECIAIKIKKGP